MSNQYDNTNSGVAFPKNNANPKAPKWGGTINVEGKEFEVAIWDKISKAGKPFLSLKIETPKNKDISSHNKAKGNAYQPQVEDEDISF